MNEDDDNLQSEDETLSEEGLQDPYESEIKKVDPYESELKKEKDAENKRIEEAKDNLTEGKIRRKRTEEVDEDLDNNLLGSRILDAIERPFASAFNWYIDKSRPDDSTYLDEVLQVVGGGVIGLGLGSYGGPKGMIAGAITGGALGFDRTAQGLGKIPGLQQLGQAQDFIADVAGKPFEALGIDPRFGGWAARVGTDFYVDRGIRRGVEGARIAILNNHYARKYPPTLLHGEGYSIGAGKVDLPQTPQQFGYFPNSNAKRVFGQDQIDEIMETARLHRVNRYAEGKGELMGGFEDSLTFTRPDGTQEIGIVVQRRNKVNKLDPTDSANYQVKTLSQLMKDIRVNTGWLVDIKDRTKEMQIVRSKLNQLGTNHPDKLLAKLMEYGDRAYLEHMIGKSQYGWLWDLKEAQPDLYPWIEATNRNAPENLRLLVSQRYKSLKDTTETRIKRWNKDLANDDKYIINIEDPMNNPYTKGNPLHKSNPGNIIIQTAKSTDKTPTTIGIVGDYLQDFYSPDFTRMYDGNRLLYIFEQMSPEDQALYALYKPKTRRVKGEKGYYKEVEDAKKYRNRVLKERLDLIIREKGNFTYEEIQEQVFIDLNNFYDLFSNKANFIRRPQYVTDAIRKSRTRDLPLSQRQPWSMKRFLQFNARKNEAMRDIYMSIQDYENGLAPRMTKKAYKNLWKQYTELSTLEYNYMTNVNDIEDQLIRITAKYE